LDAINIDCNSVTGWAPTTQTNSYLATNGSSVYASVGNLALLPVSGGRKSAKVNARYYFAGGADVAVDDFVYEQEIYIPTPTSPATDQYQKMYSALMNSSGVLFSIDYTLAKYAGTSSDTCSLNIRHGSGGTLVYSIDLHGESGATYKFKAKKTGSNLTYYMNDISVHEESGVSFSSISNIYCTWDHWIYSAYEGSFYQLPFKINYITIGDGKWPLQTGKDYVYVIPFPGGTMNFGGKEYKFVDFLERFPKEQHLAAGVSRDYEYGGPLVKYGEQIYGFLASGITDPEAEGGFGTYLPDTKRTVLSLTDRENFVNFYYIYPALPEVEKPVWVKKVITWKDVAGAAAYEVKLFLDTEEQCIDTQLVGPGVQRFDFTYFIESFMPAGNYLCTVQALATEVTRKAIVWVDTEGATSYTVNLYNSDGEIVYTDSVEPGVQTYDFTAIMPELPTGTNYYGVAIPVLPA